jgi:2'-5' RNA ligase
MNQQREQLYFIAILPPSPILEEIDILKHHFKDKYHSKASLNSPSHITLHMPFEWREEKEGKLINALTTFSENHNSFVLQLENFGCFEPRVIFINVMKNPLLDALQRELHQTFKRELNLFNAMYRDLPFYPHVTLAFRDLKKPMFYKAWEEFRDKIIEHSFKADRIALLKHDGKAWQVYSEFLFMKT